jgi:hypothetical protein
LSSDPNDLTYLSPGNFLIGAPLTSFPQPSQFDLSVVCLSGSTGNRSNTIFGKGDPQGILTVCSKEENESPLSRFWSRRAIAHHRIGGWQW